MTEALSLIYGQDIVTGAAERAISYYEKYIETTGKEIGFFFWDIYEFLLAIPVKGYRESGYKDAAKTAMSLMLGKSSLFKGRRGISFDWLTKRNCILHAHSLTSQKQCAVFLITLLYWLYRRAKLGQSSNQEPHVVVVDDSSRFTATQSKDAATSTLGHLLAVLREAGIYVIFVSQLPADTDKAVLSLCRGMITVGNINGEENLRVIQSFMSLNYEQKNQIPKSMPREVLAFISDSAWSSPAHGFTPKIELPNQEPPAYSTDYKDMIEPYHSLKNIPEENTPEFSNKEKPVSQEQQPKLKSVSDKLVLDCINYPHDNVSAHIERLFTSIGVYDSAKAQATQEGYLLESSAGKSLYLIPTKKAYEKFQQENPYERCASIEHSFYVGWTVHHLRKRPHLSKVQAETPIGTKGATIDVTTTDKSGVMTAYEITLSTSNLLSNALKLQDTAYHKIVWLCRNQKSSTAVRTYFNKARIPSELRDKFEYTFFSKFGKEK